ncbi:MAG: shikimate kinase [Thermomonas sp.]
MRNLPHTPLHIVLVGPMGAGKSCVGRLLASRLQTAFVDLDAQIEAEAGMSITAIFESEGEIGFRQHERRALAAALAKSEPTVIATGGGAVLDADNRAAMCMSARVVHVQIDPATQLQRLAGDTSRPLLVTQDPAQRLAELQAAREPLYREVADLVFDTSQHSPEAAADALASLLAPTFERSA